MNIQVVCQHYYPEQYPLTRICADLAKKGHNISVLTGLPNYPEGYIYKDYRFGKNRRQTIDGVNIVRSFLFPRGKSKAGLFINYASFAFFSMIKALFIKKDFDAILVIQSSPVTMAMAGMVLKRLTKKPLYIYTFDLWPESLVSGGVKPGSKIYNIIKSLSKWIYQSADRIFVSSKKFEEYFYKVHSIKGNIDYLPFYADDSFLGVEKPKEDKSDTLDLVFAGNIGQMQSVETIIKAAKYLEKEKVFFHIIGDGSAKEKCETLANESKIKNLKFYGRMDFSKMPEMYTMADAMLITLSNNELISYTLPNKVLSYMAAGKPIIAGVNGEAAKVIRDAECGYVADAEDYMGLADVIREFIKTENKEELSKNSRKYYNNNFTMDIFIERLKKLMDKE